MIRLGCCQLANHFDFGFINLQGKGKSSSFLTFFIVLSKLCWLEYFGIVPYRLP